MRDLDLAFDDRFPQRQRPAEAVAAGDRAEAAARARHVIADETQEQLITAHLTSKESK